MATNELPRDWGAAGEGSRLRPQDELLNEAWPGESGTAVPTTEGATEGPGPGCMKPPLCCRFIATPCRAVDGMGQVGTGGRCGDTGRCGAMGICMDPARTAGAITVLT
mmetsp:Transcript_37662/g.111777  ORF Transcript_37662/g.111777 Transcript_37662/m.111777 type:complete len:108 (-) Transcript_37662:1006-1329(-)